MQTLGGIAILFGIPALTFLSLSPDVHAWVRASINAYLPSENTIQEKDSSSASELLRRYQLPSSISKIAEISEGTEPDLSKAASIQSSDFSRAMSRLHLALDAYPNWKTEDIFRAVNEKQSAAKILPCPFERIDGEQSVVLNDGLGGVSLARTLNRCAEAVEQTAARGRSAH
jgi:hypothetical protein